MRATSIALAVGALLSTVSAAPFVLPPGAHVPEAASLPKVRLALEASADEEKRFDRTWKRDDEGGYQNGWKRDPGTVGPGGDKTWKRDPEPQNTGNNQHTWKRGYIGDTTWKREPIQASEDWVPHDHTWKREPVQASEDVTIGGGQTWR